MEVLEYDSVKFTFYYVGDRNSLMFIFLLWTIILSSFEMNKNIKSS